MNKLYHILLPAEFVLAFIVFGILFLVNAPYGKFLRSGWGPVIPSKLAWFIQEFPAFATITILFIISDGSRNVMNWIFLGIWQLHYIQRTFIYPIQMDPGSKPYPLLLVAFAVIFNIMNGYINGYYLFSIAQYSTDWLADPRFITGFIIFLSGYILNKSADQHLRRLKAQNRGSYGIPTGRAFRWISSPHYLGEILEWTGWAILTWSAAGLAFAVFTFANLAPRALAHHRWYRSNFSDYPAGRKALIPFLW